MKASVQDNNFVKAALAFYSEKIAPSESVPESMYSEFNQIYKTNLDSSTFFLYMRSINIAYQLSETLRKDIDVVERDNQIYLLKDNMVQKCKYTDGVHEFLTEVLRSKGVISEVKPLSPRGLYNMWQDSGKYGVSGTIEQADEVKKPSGPK
jgi:hypothetical protein